MIKVIHVYSVSRVWAELSRPHKGVEEVVAILLGQTAAFSQSDIEGRQI